MKKLLATLFTGVLVFSLAMPVFAQDTQETTKATKTKKTKATKTKKTKAAKTTSGSTQ